MGAFKKGFLEKTEFEPSGRKQEGEQDGDRSVGRCGGGGSRCVTETAMR